MRLVSDRTPSNRHGNPRGRHTPSSHRKNSKVHSVDTDYETGGESYQQSCYAITVSTQCLDAIDNRSTTRDEAFAVLDVQQPGLKGTGYTVRLKIDSGASGNTLPMRTFRQMYGDKADTRKLLEPANGIKLTAYNGEEIRCMGTLGMKCQHKSSGWKTTRFYVVDVPGPAVVGKTESCHKQCRWCRDKAERTNCYACKETRPQTNPEEDWEHAEANTHQQRRRPEARVPRAVRQTGTFSRRGKIACQGWCRTIHWPTSQMSHPYQGWAATRNRQSGHPGCNSKGGRAYRLVLQLGIQHKEGRLNAYMPRSTASE